MYSSQCRPEAANLLGAEGSASQGTRGSDKRETLLAGDGTERAAGLEAAARAIQQAESILITTHINPDGDAIGSSLGLWHIARAAGKTACVVNQDGAGTRYLFLPGAGGIETDTQQVFDLGVAVDCGGIGRVGRVRDALERCKTVMRIDHHLAGEPFGDIEYLDPDAAAVGEMIVEIAHALDLPVSAEAAACLLASIVEDTGCFQFSRVSALSLRICAELVAAGADLHSVVQQLYWRNPEGAARLRGACLTRMRTQCGGRLAWTAASTTDFDQFGATEEDADEVVHDMLRIGTVEVAVLLRESAKDYRVSLRSRDSVDVASLAREFGGGGHERAGGCRIGKGEADVAALIAAAAQRLEKPGNTPGVP